MPEEVRTTLGIVDIMNTIPHRFPFLLVDKVEIIEAGKKAVGYKNITMNEDCFNGHFPGVPIFPGVLAIEAMAQTAAILMLRLPHSNEKLVYLMGINNCKFRKLVSPGDTLVMNIEVLRFGGKICVFEATAKVNNEVAVEVKMTATVVDKPDVAKK